MKVLALVLCCAAFLLVAVQSIPTLEQQIPTASPATIDAIDVAKNLDVSAHCLIC